MERQDTARLTASEGRRFAFTLAAAFSVVAAVLWWREHFTAMRIVAGAGAAFLLLGAVIPGRLTAIHRAWMGMALLISKVTTPIVMGIMYFLVLTPAGMLRRTFGRSPLDIDPSADTYWVRRTDGGSREDMHRQF